LENAAILYKHCAKTTINWQEQYNLLVDVTNYSGKCWNIQQFCTSIVQKLLTGKSSIIYLLMSQITIVKVGKIRQYRANFFYVIFETGKLCRNVLIYGTKYDSKFWKIQ